MKTYSPTANSISRTWHLFDAEGAVLGRLASEIATILMGKHKATYAPHMDMADHVVVINAEKVEVTGKKEDQKLYRHHSGYPGGMKELSLSLVRQNKPQRILESAVSGMLPKNRLHDRRMKHLHIYIGPEHPYTKQFKQTQE